MRSSILISSIIVALLGANPVLAQEEEEEKQSFTCRPEIYARLVKAQEALNKSEYKKAEDLAQRVGRRRRLNKHEQALVLQTQGYIYAGQERLKLAAKTLQECWDLKSLPKATQLGILYVIGQLHMANKEPKKAVKTFDQWLKDAKNPRPDALYTIAAANYQIKDYKAAIRHGERAVKAAKKPKDALLQLVLACHIELKNWKRSAQIISIMIARKPEKKNNWIQLAAIYSEMNDEKRALAVMELAFEAGVLEKSGEYVQVAQRLLSEDVPQEAGVLLEKHLKDGKIEMNASNAKLLATAWVQSRDADKAVPALGQAAKLADDGELYVRLAQVELERENWKEAVAASEKALKKGVKSRGQVHLLVGIAEVRAGNDSKAIKAFERAKKDESTRRAAMGWIKFIAANAEAKRARSGS